MDGKLIFHAALYTSIFLLEFPNSRKQFFEINSIPNYSLTALETPSIYVQREDPESLVTKNKKFHAIFRRADEILGHPEDLAFSDYVN